MRKHWNTLLRQQKVLLALLAAMVPVFFCLTAYQTRQEGLPFRDGFLPLRETSPTVYAGKIGGRQVCVTVRPDNKRTEISFALDDAVNQFDLTPSTEQPDAQGWVVSRDGAEIFRGSYELSYTAQFGTLYPQSAPAEGLFDALDTGDARWQSFTPGAGTAFYFLEPNTTHRGSWPIFALATFLTLFMMVSIAFPMTFSAGSTAAG